MKQSKTTLNLLIFLLGFLSLGAFYGGIVLILSPDGSMIEMPAEMLKNSPFRNYLIPGILLLVIFGIFPALIIYGLIKKPESRVFNLFNSLYDHHYAWTFSIYIGLAQIIWIDLQTLYINSVSIIHVIYSGLGIAIVSIALLPQTRKLFILIKN